MLPKIPYIMKKNKSQSIPMRSINLGSAAEAGELSDSFGISTRKFPYLTTRSGDKKLESQSKKNIRAMTVFNGEPVIITENGDIYIGDERVGGYDHVEYSEIKFVAINTKLVIYPLKRYFERINGIWEDKSLEATVSGFMDFAANAITVIDYTKQETAVFDGGYFNSSDNSFNAPQESAPIIKDDVNKTANLATVHGKDGTKGYLYNVIRIVDQVDVVGSSMRVDKSSASDFVKYFDKTLFLVNETSIVFAGEVGFSDEGDYFYGLVPDSITDGTYAIYAEDNSPGGANFHNHFEKQKFYAIVSRENNENVMITGIVSDIKGSCVTFEYADVTASNVYMNAKYDRKRSTFAGDFSEGIEEGDKISFEWSYESPFLPEKISLRNSGEYIAEKVLMNKIIFSKSTLVVDETLTSDVKVYKRAAMENAFGGLFVGDGVEVSGAATPKNNTAFMINKIDERSLYASANIFVDEPANINNEITISRRVPDLDFICEKDNRLYGVSNKDKTIYVSALGDPTNMFAYEGVSTDSFAVAVGGEGDFTACCKCGDSVLFFKEDKLYKLTGSYPAEFALYSYDVSGIDKGSEKSCAVINEVLYYLGRDGVYAYTGGIPTLISSCFGEKKFEGGVAGTDGRYYYISVTDENKNPYLFTYDTRTQLWIIEERIRCNDFAKLQGGLRYLSNGDLYQIGAGETPTRWLARWAPIYETIEGKKSYSRIVLRVSIPKDSYMSIRLRFDGGYWHNAGAVVGKSEGVIPVRIPINRCDKFELELSGEGECTILDIMREYYISEE
jgi:hypothetical protein